MITQKQIDTRIAQERRAIRHLIRSAKKSGFALTKVFDGDETIKCKTENEAMNVVFSVDEATIYFKHPKQPRGHCAVIVLGNSGPECIADCSEGELWDGVMQEVSDYCDKMECA